MAGDALSGIFKLFRSPYLLRIALFVALMTFASTVLYFVQADLLESAIQDRGERRALLGRMDLAANVLTILAQGVLFAHLVRWLGVGICLAMIPALVCIGFLTLGIYPLLTALIIVQVLYRSGRYAALTISRWLRTRWSSSAATPNDSASSSASRH